MQAYTALMLFLLASGASPEFISPDGKSSYKCGPERNSAAACYNAWTKTTLDGKAGNWIPGYCTDKPNIHNRGSCYGGGVPWWWWNGSGKIGDPILKDFWFRDYAGPAINGVIRNNNSYGNAIRLPGPYNCYVAKQSTFCMEIMQSP